MGSDIYINPEKWMPFISGHWQKEMPTKVGTYPASDFQGKRVPDRHVALTKEGKAWNPDPGECEWIGWWWSEPYPEFPKPPEWEAVDVSGWGTAE